MSRLTLEGDFCDIAGCLETCGGSFCEDGACSQRKTWERLKHYEDLEEQGRLVILPFGGKAELLRDGMVFKGSHWNHVLTAFADDPEAHKGKRLGLFGIEDAESVLNGGADNV